mgnify:FL=1
MYRNKRESPTEKIKMIEQIKNDVHKVLETAIQIAVNINELKIDKIPKIIFSPTKAPEHGDIASPIALSLAKSAGIGPRQVAEIIIDKIDLEKQPLINQIDVAGPGFINIFIDNNWMASSLKEIHLRGDKFGYTEHGQDKKILVEFVSANPTGPLNIVSGRAAAVGSTIINLLNMAGYQATSEFYINDAGGQVLRLGASLDVRYRQQFGYSNLEIPEDGYHGQYLVELSEELKQEVGNKYLDLSENDRIRIFCDLAVERLLSDQKKSLERFGVEFDVWSSEKDIRESGAPEQIIQSFKDQNLLYESEGATWFKMTNFGDDKDTVVIKSDGEYTYFVPDAAYHQNKFNRGFHTLIDLLGPDHQGHISHLECLLRALGYDQSRLECLIIQQVSLVDSTGQKVEMSKRKGQLITLDNLLDRLGESVDEHFAVDVARYFFLNRSNNSHLDFDFDLALKRANDNPVFYLQYAYARSCSIFREMTQRGLGAYEFQKADLSLLNSIDEQQMIRKMAEFPQLVIASADNRQPHRLVNYLQDLANQFHTFYNKSRVLNVEQIDLSYARLALVSCLQIVLRNGLKILGLSTPERM